MNKQPIEALHATRVEHKIVFYIDGKKYGFRTGPEVLEALNVEEGATIPFLDGWGISND